VRAIPPPWPPSVNAGRTIAGSPISDAARALGALLAIDAARHAQPRLDHRLAEQLAVLGAADRLVAGADQLDAEALERAVSRSALARLSAVCPPSVASSASGRSRSMICVTGPGSSGSM
jgi:hypothetical protein